MTQGQLDKLEPKKSVVYPKKEGKCVRYTFMGMTDIGNYQLYGMPFGYSKSVMLECFEVLE